MGSVIGARRGRHFSCSDCRLTEFAINNHLSITQSVACTNARQPLIGRSPGYDQEDPWTSGEGKDLIR
jgi:hypothetical protein